jgi:hypothetical protein
MSISFVHVFEFMVLRLKMLPWLNAESNFRLELAKHLMGNLTGIRKMDSRC